MTEGGIFRVLSRFAVPMLIKYFRAAAVCHGEMI